MGDVLGSAVVIHLANLMKTSKMRSGVIIIPNDHLKGIPIQLLGKRIPDLLQKFVSPLPGQLRMCHLIQTRSRRRVEVPMRPFLNQHHGRPDHDDLALADEPLGHQSGAFARYQRLPEGEVLVGRKVLVGGKVGDGGKVRCLGHGNAATSKGWICVCAVAIYTLTRLPPSRVGTAVSLGLIIRIRLEGLACLAVC
jgi:hypothetical protein